MATSKLQSDSSYYSVDKRIKKRAVDPLCVLPQRPPNNDTQPASGARSVKVRLRYREVTAEQVGTEPIAGSDVHQGLHCLFVTFNNLI